jgi:hypothetical protein
VFGNGKSTLILKVWVVFMSIAMTTVGFSASTNGARVIPTGKVTIIKDGRVVGEFSKEAPLLEGSLLRCEDQCAVKLDDTYMVVAPETEFSVTPGAGHTELYAKEGTVYYAMNESSSPLQIDTPNGEVTTGDLIMTDSEVRGYVRVSGNETEIGVIGGGTMMMETASGEMAVTPGNAITLAAAGSETSGAAADGTASEETGGLTRDQIIAIGVGSATVLAAGGSALASSSGNSSGGGGGGDDDGDGSPSSP